MSFLRGLLPSRGHGLPSVGPPPAFPRLSAAPPGLPISPMRLMISWADRGIGSPAALLAESLAYSRFMMSNSSRHSSTCGAAQPAAAATLAFAAASSLEGSRRCSGVMALMISSYSRIRAKVSLLPLLPPTSLPPRLPAMRTLLRFLAYVSRSIGLSTLSPPFSVLPAEPGNWSHEGSQLVLVLSECASLDNSSSGTAGP
mmetsp:Transcript_4001/g.9571  ORF Transcript_4001/g.9571 Transcript_4001/m.9571 type:complete len:200 (+) Transcript_4001:156-755(+)